MNTQALLVGLFSGVLASMGLGGGTILVIYLVFFQSFMQIEAGGTNLLFFIPVATVSVIIYAFKKQIRIKEILPIVIGGIAGSIIAVFFVSGTNNRVLSKLFGVFLCILGIKEIVSTIKLYLKNK